MFGTLIIILTNTIYFFFLGRFLQSLGDGGAALLSGIIIGDYYKGRAYAKLQAILSISLSLAWAGAPLLGERLFTLFGWRGNFSFILILSALLMSPLFFWKEKKKPSKIRKGIFSALKKSRKTMSSLLSTSLLGLSLAQAFPLGIFTAFEFMMPFIYKETYGFSVKESSVVFFIFIIINVGASFLYIIFINYMTIKKMFRIGMYVFLVYFILGLLILNLHPMFIYTYIIFGLLSFSIPFIIISTSTKIVDSHPQHLGVALALLTIIRNTGTTAIPLFSCMLSQNSFSSFFNVTLIASLLTVGFLFRHVKF